MPELPEVETIRRGLSERIVGKKIADLSFDWPKSFQGKKVDVVGDKIMSVERRAKTIRMRLDNHFNLLFHLKMTGQLIYRDETKNHKLADQFAGGHPDHDWHAELPNKHTRIIFDFDDNSKLYFNDLRKFGWCKVLTDSEVEAIHEKDYGLEPFDKSFGPDYLQKAAAKIPNRKIKQFLTEQTIIAGIGNIYADESLFLAGISPFRTVKDISSTEWKTIVDAIIKVLNKAIKYGGTTDSDYVDSEGKKGGMQNHLNVYHKEGEPCPNSCGGKIVRVKIGGRSTHYCLGCQR